MEPPIKRARHGRAPHDDYAGFAMPMDYNSKNIGPSKAGTGSEGDEDGDDGDDEDEIAMDPEDYAMKLNPQYRIQKSRAVADNRLKSAFELLFEKYSKDFGDTGDEINFYTDEIEVDNGHITSILAEEDVEDDDKDDVRRNGRSAEEIGRGLSLLSSGPIHVPKDDPAADSTASEPGPVTLDSEAVDPVWAAPTIPDDEFSTPRPQGQPIQPPRIAYSVPHRSIFRASLPKSFGTVASAKTGKWTKNGHTKLNPDDNDDDLLLMDTSEPILRFSHAEKTPRRRVSNWAGPSPGTTPTDSPLLSASSSLPPAAPTSSSTIPLPPLPPSSVLSAISQPYTKAAAPSATASKTRADTAAKPAANGRTETFSRNTLDPSYVFSDEEDFGLKKRAPMSTPASVCRAADAAAATPTTTTEKKRGRGRPRIHPIKMPRRLGDVITKTNGPIYSSSPIPLPPLPPSSVLSAIAQPNTKAAAPSATARKTTADTAAKPAANEKTETFSRNTLDPSYVFSDDEDFGFKKRDAVPNPALVCRAADAAAATPTTTTEKKRGRGRPRIHPIKMPRRMGDAITKTNGPIYSSSPIPVPTIPSYKPSPIYKIPVPVPAAPQPQSQPTLPLKRPVGRPRKIRPENMALTAATPAAGKAHGQEHPHSSPQPTSAAYTPSKPPTQELRIELTMERSMERPKKTPKETPIAPPCVPVYRVPPPKRPVGRPRKVKEPGSVSLQVGTPLNAPLPTQPQKRPVGRPRKIKPAEAGTPETASALPKLLEAQGTPLNAPLPTQPQKRPVGRPRKIKPAEAGTPETASATPTTSKTPGHVLSPPLLQSVAQVKKKHPGGRPKKSTAVNGPAPGSSTPVDGHVRSQSLHPSQPSQELPQQPLRQSQSRPLSQPLSQPLLHLPKSPSVQRTSRAEIPDSDATIPSSNTSRPYAFPSSLRSEIPDSEVCLSSSIVAIVSDDSSDDGRDDGSDGSGRGYDAVEAAVPTRRAPRSPTHSPARSTATTPFAAARFVVMPYSGGSSPTGLGFGSGRASPLAKSILRTPSPIKLDKLGKLGIGSRWAEAQGEHATAASPSGSVVQTPGGTMRRCGQGGFRCERKFCFKCT